MRIKTINLISSRKISGAQKEFGNGFFTILPCTYCLGIVGNEAQCKSIIAELGEIIKTSQKGIVD